MLFSRKIAYTSFLLFFAQAVMAQTSTGEPIRHVKTTEKVIALTFDDGPDEPYT